jgi:lipoprotein-anchoring transpeptidase ErfK/SrfK
MIVASPGIKNMQRLLTLVSVLAVALPAMAQMPSPATAPAAAPANAPTGAPPATPAAPPASLLDLINAQGMAGEGDRGAIKRQLIRAQVILDRRHLSPGVIDGATGSNLRLALRAFQASAGLPVNGKLDVLTWDTLVASDAAPAIRDYTIVVADIAGPFAEPVSPGDFAAMATRESMTWTSAIEALAERAHMDEALLRAMNPAADFGAVGTVIFVTDTARSDLAAVAEIRVDKGHNEVSALDAAGKTLAVYPATLGSSERPAPSGTWAVRTVAPAPNYTFDPGRLSFRPKGGGTGKLTIPPGPNNPVGSTWIDLTRDTYGIHGTPDPRMIGKAASNGCVRLTNWDARELAAAVKAGTKVVFSGSARR